MKIKVFLIPLSLAVLMSITILFPTVDQPAFAQKVIRLKVAHYFPPPANQSKLMESFCKELETRTNGRVKVDYFAGGSLLKAPAMFEGVVNGIADIGYSHVYDISDAVDHPLKHGRGF
jgi:TRAP-type C4-dicarboxylate transport system substrate-binding protein